MMEEKPIESPKKDHVIIVEERMRSPEISEKEEVGEKRRQSPGSNYKVSY